MGNLKLSDWSSIAEILTSVAVVASLAYVGLELSQNTTAIQQTSYQSVLDRLSQGDLMIASDKDLHRIVTTAEVDPSALSEEDWSRFKHFAFPRYGEWEYLYLANKADAISELQWTAFRPYFVYLSCLPGYQRFWKESRFAYAESFQTYVDREQESECGI